MSYSKRHLVSWLQPFEHLQRIVNFDLFKSLYFSQNWTRSWLTPNLGILWISVCSSSLYEWIVAYPIIYRLAPSPPSPPSPRFETRQYELLRDWTYNLRTLSRALLSWRHLLLFRDLTPIRRRRRIRRLVKNVFIFYFGISHLFGSIQCVCRYSNLPFLNMLRMRSVPNRNTKN